MTYVEEAISVRTPILVIEDEPSVSAFLRAALERKGYAVVPTSSGAEGLELLATRQFRGVISDIRTPGRFRLRAQRIASLKAQEATNHRQRAWSARTLPRSRPVRWIAALDEER